MATERLPLGVFTTDDHLVVRTWDDWMAAATGIAAGDARGRALAGVLPDISQGGLAIIEQVLAHGTVEVMATALHHYLFACAPVQPSPVFARMQQLVTIGPLRDETRIAGVAVTVEDVTARVEHERAVADAGGRHVESLARLMGEDEVRIRRMAVSTLAHHGPAVVDALVRTLREQHEDFSALSSALDLLSISDIDVVEPLIGCLKDRDPNLRIQAALILGLRRDRRAGAPLIASLDDPDVNVRFHVIEALGRLRAADACDALTAIALEREFFLAFPAIQALSELGNPTVAAHLVPLLADDLLRAPVIEALGALGDEESAAPLVDLLNACAAPADVITDALAGLYDRYESRYAAGAHIADLVRRRINAAGTQSILDAVQSVSADRLPALAKVLGWLQGEAVQRALTRLLGHESVRSHVVEALVRNGAGVVTLLIERLRAEDLDTRQAAAVALGRIGDRRATGALIAALEDREIAVAAAGALARIGDGSAFDALIARLGDADSAIRQSVIAALNSIGHPDMPRRIVALLGSGPDPIVRESALKIAGYFGYPECLDQVLACCRDMNEAVRRTAMEQLAFFDDPRAFAPLAQACRDEAPSVRAAAASALGRIDHPDRVVTLMRALGDTDPWVRFVALRSLGTIGDPASLNAVIDRLDDPAPHVRLAAIEVIGRLKPIEALAVLEPLTQSSNDDVARTAVGALGHVDQAEALSLLEQFARAPESWKRLAAIEALARHQHLEVPRTLQWVAAVDEAPEVVSVAMDALAKVGWRNDGQGSEAARALIALTAEPARRESAIAVLSSLPPRRIADIAAGLQHPSADVRCASVEALGRMKHPEASRALEAALDDLVSAVRLTAVSELKHLGTRTSQRKLMALARADQDTKVRHAAIMAVARAHDADAHDMDPRGTRG